MTTEERHLLHALSKCQFHAASADGRFCRDLWMAAAGLDGGYALTEGQRAYLKRLSHRYREQLPRIMFRLEHEAESAPAALNRRILV